MATSLALGARRPGSMSSTVRWLGERRAVVVESNSEDGRGALAVGDGQRIEAAARLAVQSGLPLVLVIASSGADIGAGLPSLHSWGRAARAVVHCSGVVPTLAVVDGPAVSGPALLLGLVDHVVMTETAFAYVSGPNMVRAFTGEDIGTDELGGAWAQARHSGVAALLASGREVALGAVTELLAYLPSHCDELPPTVRTDDPKDRATPEALACLPAAPTGSYDVRQVVRAVVDDATLVELRAAWAPNLVTGLASLDGAVVGVLANQPQAIAGTLDIAASQKGARFVAFCDAFNIPLVTFVDTPGFYPGKDLEWRGMIRHGAQLAFAYARASVPRVAVTLRKSYGGAYIVMDSRFMGNDVMLAWPSAEIAVMGARQAAEILMRRAGPPERDAFVADYEQRLLNPYVAAGRGTVDHVVEPDRTRAVLCAALSTMLAKREVPRGRRHDNTPL